MAPAERRARRRGTSLVEVLLGAALSGLVFGLVWQVAAGSSRHHRDIEILEGTLADLDAVRRTFLGDLRALHSGEEVETTDQELTLVTPEGLIEWSRQPDGSSVALVRDGKVVAAGLTEVRFVRALELAGRACLDLHLVAPAAAGGPPAALRVRGVLRREVPLPGLAIPEVAP